MAYCNRCGSMAHFGGQCPHMGIPKPVGVRVEPKRMVEAEFVEPERSGENPETVRKREWRARNRERYNAYQREYMRRYRSGQ